MEQLDGVISYDCPPFVKIRCDDDYCVSARGIDVEQLDGVISYDCPPFVKTYIHRQVHMYLFYKLAFAYPLEVLREGAVAGDGFLLFYHIIPLAKLFNIDLSQSKQKILFAIFRRMHLSKTQHFRYCPFKCNYCRTFSSHTEFFFSLFATAYTFFKESF